jgi:TetR/AcrR family fatty acid metabolism transcriptional regulator
LSPIEVAPAGRADYILNMRPNSESSGRSRGSFIEQARRSQIVETAIRTIAERGYSQASLAEIAREAGISKGVISYHFEGKDELFEEILARLRQEPAEFVKCRVDACESAHDKLRAYVRANFEFMKSHRTAYVALVDMWGSRGTSPGARELNAQAYEPSRKYIARILDSGRQSGELALESSMTVASVIQAAIDGVMLQWVFDEQHVDLEACSDEILRMISRNLSVESGPELSGPRTDRRESQR